MISFISLNFSNATSLGARLNPQSGSSRRLSFPTISIASVTRLSTSPISSTVFTDESRHPKPIFLSATFLLNQTQTVKVDNVEFEIPADYVSEPLRTDVNYDGNVKSSAMGWSNKDNYIEIGVTRTPGKGINSQKVAEDLGGTPTKMYGYTGYYLEYENEGYAFVFGIKDEVCMVYVSSYDVFDDIKVIGAV